MKFLFLGASIWAISLTMSGCLGSGGTTIIDDKRTYETPWREPNSQELGSIGRLMVKNNISGCGEYYVKEVESGEYLVACTSDGKNWTYYIAYPDSGKIYLANEEMISILKPPY